MISVVVVVVVVVAVVVEFFTGVEGVTFQSNSTADTCTTDGRAHKQIVTAFRHLLALAQKDNSPLTNCTQYLAHYHTGIAIR